MKHRNGFVSNSSSCSFVICKKDLTDTQIAKIHNHIEEGEKLGMYANEHDAWNIRDRGGALKLSTNMDNFDMTTFLKRIGVDRDLLEWEEY